MQELLLKIGDSSKVSLRKKIINVPKINGKSIIGKHQAYDVNWLLKSKCHNTQNKGLSPSSTEEWIDYEGNVYCITVPNHLLFVRRNGTPVWCGNSLRVYIDSGTDEVYDIISKYEHKSAHTCEICGKPAKCRSTNPDGPYGWYYTSCDECEEKRQNERNKNDN